MDAQVVTLNDMVGDDLNPSFKSDPRADNAEIRVWGDLDEMKSKFDELKDIYTIALEKSNRPESKSKDLVAELRSQNEVAEMSLS